MREMTGQDSRRVTAERNVEAILDATRRLLEHGSQPNMSAVAAEAGVSRPTLYAHFGDRGQLIEALVERTVRGTVVAVDAAEPERGPAVDALHRLIDASWTQLARHEAI